MTHPLVRLRPRSPLLGLLLLTVTAAAAPAPATTVALPDSGTYAYWVQSKTGALSIMPVTMTGQKKISLPPGSSQGDTLYVLDKHNGAVAALLVSGAATAQALTVGDFKPLTTPRSAPTPVAASPTPPAASPAPETENGFLRLLTVVLGLLVAAGVVWVILRLIHLRGQPLIDAARRMGVDVPDPEALDPEAEAAPVYAPPTPRAVEKIPEEAGAPPAVAANPAPARRGSVGTLEAPQIVGVQGLAAGSSFAVPIGEISIGRDGDNGIVLAESTVSRRHALLARDGDGRITLTDEGSANGVFVNGLRVKQATLTPGDQIQIGDSYFRLES